MHVHTSASLRTGIVRLVVASAVLVATLAIATGSAVAHDGPWSGQWPGQHRGHSWGWSHRHGHCHHVPTPAAAFTFNPAAPFAGDVVQFDATASTAGTVGDDDDKPITGKIVTYDWNFGDGGTSTGSTATAAHSFVDAGSFVVSLTVTNDAGKSATVTQTVAVTPLPVPTAAFTFDPAAPNATRAVQFDASTSTGGESSGRLGTIVKYDWNFGDGSTAAGSDPATTHTFVDAGTFDVTLTVTNDSGKTAGATQSVVVATVPTPVPIAAFTISPAGPVAGRDVQFDASTSVGGQDRDVVGTIVKYDWNFGDGVTASSATPVVTHVFADGGTFAITLTVTNDAGQSDDAVQTLAVAPPPPPYDPGGGPKSAIGGGPSVVSPVAPQSLITSSRSAGKVAIGFSVAFDVPAGVSPTAACSGSANVVVSSGKLRKVHGRAAAGSDRSGCSLRFNVSLPKGYAGKKAKFAFAFAGNSAVAPWSITRTLAVR